MTQTTDTAAAAIDRAVAAKTICSMFADTVAAHRDEPVLRWHEEAGWQTLTWGQYRQAVQDMTLGLRAFGFERGQFAMILARNVPEHLIADLAIIHGGGTAISVYTLAPEQLEYLANHSEATIALVEDEGFLAKLQSIRTNLTHLEHIVLMRGQAPAVGGVVGREEVMAKGRLIAQRDPQAFEESWQGVQPRDLTALIYTSGTTGPPKRVMYSHRNVTWTTVSGWTHLEVDRPLRQVSYLPLAHIAEKFASHWGSVYRGDLVSLCPEQAQLLPALLEAHFHGKGCGARDCKRALVESELGRDSNEHRLGTLDSGDELWRRHLS